MLSRDFAKFADMVQHGCSGFYVDRHLVAEQVAYQVQ